MRKTEIERLNTLRKKVQAGKDLNEKESERLEQLEDKLSREVEGLKQKESEKGLTESEKEKLEESTNLMEGGLEVGRGEKRKSSGDDSNGGSQSNSGEGNSRGSREESRKGESSQRTNRNESNFKVGATDSENGRSSRPSGNSVGEYGSENRGSKSSNRGSDGGRGGSSRGSRTEIAGGEAEQSEELLQGLSNVNIPAPKVIKPSRKNSRTSKSKKSDDLEAEDIGAILMTGFSLIASSTRRPHWNISEEEAEAVAIPLDDILQDMTKTKRKAIKKKMAPIMLASAVAGIVVPRLMVDLASMKGGKKLVQRQRQPIEPINSGTESEINKTSKGDIQSTIGERPSESEGASADVKTSYPVNDSEIAGLLRGSNK